MQYSPAPMALDDDARDELAQLDLAGRRRGRRVLSSRQGVRVVVDGRDVVSFSANDYLGLAGHPDLEAAAIEAMRRRGVGTGASRLIIGNTDEHEDLEREIAAWLERPAVCLFNSGYAANTGVVPVIARAGDVILSDALNHASLIDGCRLARADVEVYRHLDLGDLERRLDEHRGAGKRCVVVTETLFSMDGDVVDVVALDALRRRYGASLVLDEAHALGAIGDGGRGIALPRGVVPDVLVGTLGKALGTFGAFAATTPAVAELLWNRARSLVFSTAMPAAIAAAARAAIHLASGRDGDARRARLAERVKEVRAHPRFGASTSAIQPLLIGDDAATMRVAERLLERGVYVQGIRPPTVPVGTSRLRVALSSEHAPDDVDRMLAELDDAMRQVV